MFRSLRRIRALHLNADSRHLAGGIVCVHESSHLMMVLELLLLLMMLLLLLSSLFFRRHPELFERVRGENRGCRIIADYTGGTKTMTTGLAMAAIDDGNVRLHLTISDRSPGQTALSGYSSPVAVSTAAIHARRLRDRESRCDVGGTNVGQSEFHHHRSRHAALRQGSGGQTCAHEQKIP